MRAFPFLCGARARRLLVSLFVLGGVSLASAQTVTVRGVVEDDGATFVLGCTPLTLVSAGPNLNALLGQDVEAVGTVIGPHLLSVSSATPVTDVFQLNNNAQIGGTLKFEVTGPPGRLEQFYVAVSNGFVVVKGMGWFLGLTAQHLLVQGVIPATGKLQMTLNIPNNPILVGLDVFLQDVRLTAGSPLQLGNPDCVTIQA